MAALLCTALVVSGCASVEGDWGDASRADTIEAYESFLKKHPNAGFSTSARREIAWKRARQEDAIAAYRTFLRKFPHSAHEKTANERIRAIESEHERDAWKKAQEANTAEAYRVFLRRHRQSEHSAVAEQRAQQLELEQVRRDWQQVQGQGTVSAYEDFLRRHPESEFVEEAGKWLEGKGEKGALREARARFSADRANLIAKGHVVMPYVIAYRPIRVEPHFVVKEPNGRYLRITMHGTRPYGNGMDVPFLRYARPREFMVLFMSVEDASRSDVNDTFNKLRKQAADHFNVELHKSALLFATGERTEKGESEVLQRCSEGRSALSMGCVVLSHIADTETLVAELKDPNADRRKSAVTALGLLRVQGAVEPLIEVLRGQDQRDRQLAAKTLGEIGDPGAVEALIEALKDKDWRVRQAAARALGAIKDSRAVEPLTAASKDRDSDVRRAAAEALRLIRSRGSSR